MRVKYSVVFPSYAVIDPWTMMVKSIYTAIAEVAVSRSWSPYDLTKRTERTRSTLLEQTQKVRVFFLFQNPRVGIHEIDSDNLVQYKESRNRVE